MKLRQFAVFFFLIVVYGSTLFGNPKGEVNVLLPVSGLIETGEFEEAIKLGKRIIKRNKSKDLILEVNAVLLLAEASYLWCDFISFNEYVSKAETIYNNEKESNPLMSIAGVYLLNVYILSNQFIKAEELVKKLDSKIIAFDTDIAFKYLMLKAQLKENAGDFKGAFSLLDQLIDILKNVNTSQSGISLADVYYQKGLCEIAYGDPNAAGETYSLLQNFLKKRTSSKGNFIFNHLKGKIEEYHGNFNNAIRFYLASYNSVEWV
jgi:hypothetical protein